METLLHALLIENLNAPDIMETNGIKLIFQGI
jgi:hypothetical protein